MTLDRYENKKIATKALRKMLYKMYKKKSVSFKKFCKHYFTTHSFFNK